MLGLGVPPLTIALAALSGGSRRLASNRPRAGASAAGFRALLLGRWLAIAEWGELLADEPDDEVLEVHRGVAVDVMGGRVAGTATRAVGEEQELALGNLRQLSPDVLARVVEPTGGQRFDLDAHSSRVDRGRDVVGVV